MSPSQDLGERAPGRTGRCRSKMPDEIQSHRCLTIEPERCSDSPNALVRSASRSALSAAFIGRAHSRTKRVGTERPDEEIPNAVASAAADAWEARRRPPTQPKDVTREADAHAFTKRFRSSPRARREPGCGYPHPWSTFERALSQPQGRAAPGASRCHTHGELSAANNGVRRHIRRTLRTAASKEGSAAREDDLHTEREVCPIAEDGSSAASRGCGGAPAMPTQRRLNESRQDPCVSEALPSVGAEPCWTNYERGWLY